jgi:hypothetical protein
MANAARALSLSLIVLIASGCEKSYRAKNVCPIDGQPAQWSGARKGNSCEYSHYSIIEKKTHSWWAACEK